MKVNLQSVLEPMENLKRSFSNKFLERVQELGSILPINDEKFYLVFNSYNSEAAFIQYKGKDSIAVSELAVLDYSFLKLKTKEVIEEGCNEGDTIWILKNLHDK